MIEFLRLWCFGKLMCCVLVVCWGIDVSWWVGCCVIFYCDELVRFGNDVVGGIRISYLLYIDGVKRVLLLVFCGRSVMFIV